VNFGQAVLQLGAPASFAEAINVLRDRGSQWLADTFGVSRRTAQRWLAGTQQPGNTEAGRARRQAVMRTPISAATRRRLAAAALRRARTLSVGKIKVATKSTGKPAGSRSIGTVLVDAEARVELDEVADLLDAGEIGDAELAMSECVLGLYAVQTVRGGRENRDAARAHLYVYDYPTGFRTG
jgi:hypothetical protein